MRTIHTENNSKYLQGRNGREEGGYIKNSLEGQMRGTEVRKRAYIAFIHPS